MHFLISLFFFALVSHAQVAQARQICPAGLPRSTPSSDFADAGPGMVLHRPTGLIWKRCSEGSVWNGEGCSGGSIGLNWQSAFERVKAVNQAPKYARYVEGRSDLPWWLRAMAPVQNSPRNVESLGQTDWRVPNINELRSIVESGCHSPALNLAEFPSEASSWWRDVWNDLSPSHIESLRHFWSSSPLANDGTTTWAVGFTDGMDDAVQVTRVVARVRLVRGGEGFHGFEAVSAPIQERLNESPRSRLPEESPEALGASKPVPTEAWEPIADSIPIPDANEAEEANDGSLFAPGAQRLTAVPSLSKWGLWILSVSALLLGARRLRSGCECPESQAR